MKPDLSKVLRGSPLDAHLTGPPGTIRAKFVADTSPSPFATK